MIFLLFGSQREYIILNLTHYILLYYIKISAYRMGIKFKKGPLSIEQNSYFTKIVNVCIVYDLDAWLGNSTNNFKFTSCLFAATNIVKIVIEKRRYTVDTE